METKKEQEPNPKKKMNKKLLDVKIAEKEKQVADKKIIKK